MSPVRQTFRMLLAGGAVAGLSWFAISAIEKNRTVEATGAAAGFADAAEYKAASAKGFDKPEAYRRYLDTERVEQQKRDAEAAKVKAREEAQWQEAIRYVVALRKGMKNPDSFKLESAIRTKDGFYCFEYRATNSFNAMIPGQAIVGNGKAATSDQRNVMVPLWNKHCTKPGEDLHTLVFAAKSGLF